MKPFAATLLAASLLLVSKPAVAAEVTGTYQVRGWNPGVAVGAAPSYGGSLAVKRQAEGYVVQWTVGKSVTKGVGFVKAIGGKSWLAACYANNGEAASVLYEIAPDGKSLKGEWVGDGCRIGNEVATR